MDTVKDNKKVNFPITKLTIGLAALGVAGGVFFGALLSTQGVAEETIASDQSLTISDSLKNSISLDDESGALGEKPIDGNNQILEENSKSDNGEIVAEAPEEETVTKEDSNSTGSESEEVKEEEPKVEPKPTKKAEQKVESETDQAEIKPAPAPEKPAAKPEQTQEPAKPKPTPEPVEKPEEAHKGPPLGTPYCPGYREENPSLYDSCHAGFVAPTLEWAGYHSCEKTPAGNVRIFGKVKLVGGNYNKDYYGWNSRTVEGYGIVNSVNSSAPYFVSWDNSAWFGSMSKNGAGIIAQIDGSGMQKIDESLLDPSCRF